MKRLMETRDDALILQARLQRFWHWLLAVLAVIAMLMTVALMQTHTLNALLGTASIYGLVALLLIARFPLADRPSAAVILFSVGVFGLVVVDIVVLPRALPVLVFLPVMAVAMALPYLSGRSIVCLSSAATAATGVSASLSEFVHRFAPIPGRLSQIILILAVTGMSGLTLLLLHQYQHRQTETIAAVQAANAALEHVRAQLETEVTTRTADLRTALHEVETRSTAQAQLLDELAEQRLVIRELSVPVLPVNATTLVMPLVGTLDTARLQQVQEQALHAITRTNVRSLVLDITGVPVVDGQVAHGLLAVVQATRLLGAEAILVGIRPEVAQALVGLGITLPGLRTFPDLQTAIARLTTHSRS